MVAKSLTWFTVNGGVPLTDEGAGLYSHRTPYVIVKERVNFQVSWANKLTFVKANVAGSLASTAASGMLFARTFAREKNTYSALYAEAFCSGFRRR